jgi:hypothetical protein
VFYTNPLVYAFKTFPFFATANGKRPIRRIQRAADTMFVYVAFAPDRAGAEVVVLTLGAMRA